MVYGIGEKVVVDDGEWAESGGQAWVEDKER